jgi:cell division protein FtsL
VSDLTAMVLMVMVTLIALSVIWGTYVRRRLLARRG